MICKNGLQKWSFALRSNRELPSALRMVRDVPVSAGWSWGEATFFPKSHGVSLDSELSVAGHYFALSMGWILAFNYGR